MGENCNEHERALTEALTQLAAKENKVAPEQVTQQQLDAVRREIEAAPTLAESRKASEAAMKDLLKSAEKFAKPLRSKKNFFSLIFG